MIAHSKLESLGWDQCRSRWHWLCFSFGKAPGHAKASSQRTPRPIKQPVNASDPDAEAAAAPEDARHMPGPAGTAALRKAGILL